MAQESPKEEDYYKILTPPIPEGMILEIGGLTTLPNGSIGMSTRRGEVWIMENPTSRSPYFRKFASGLHEILGLAWKDGALYCAQRGELTKLVDKDGDGKAEIYETVYSWPVSGHYHEYSFGPKIAPDGSFFVSGNVAFGDEEWWRGESRVPGRGWIFRITPDGKFEPYATGVRSPAGISMLDGELFYTDNQGDWMGSGGIWHVKKGSFMGHPAGLKWANMPNSPVKLTEKQFFAEMDNQQVKDANGRYIKPENNPNDKNPRFLYQLKEKYPESVQLPAVWLPYGIHGISTAEVIKDDTQGKFGPFAGQFFVGDQGQSKIMRVVLEKVNGEYQGAAIDFRSGFQSGVLRMTFAKDGSMFVGETNRGWGSAGDANQGLQRVVWNGKLPFEMYTVKAKPDGFEVNFTMPVDRKSAENLNNYVVSSFLYKYHAVYGSPPTNTEQVPVKGVKISEDGKTVRIVVDNLRKYYIHHLDLSGIRAANTYYSLVHPSAYYTLNNIPTGEKLKLAELTTTRSGEAKAVADTKSTMDLVSPDGKNQRTTAAASDKAPTFEEVKPLLQRNTCLACHAADKRVVGPSYKDVAKRNYTNEQIVDLIYNPKPSNWPDYATPMAAMPQVPKDEALKIASWINSLK
jgi:cytochrome c551/c552